MVNGDTHCTRDPYRQRRLEFVTAHLVGRGIEDPRLLDAFRRVRRERFCPAERRDAAYADRPLPIGHGQTISQPSLVAYMTEALALAEGEKVLEIGTGSGFQAAILAEMGVRVFSIEVVEALAEQAARTLCREGYSTAVQVRAGDGYRGWPEEAPFDAIVLTAAPERVPDALMDQLRPGAGRLLLPEGPQSWEGQVLELYRKAADGSVSSETLLPVRFVPMVRGEA